MVCLHIQITDPDVAAKIDGFISTLRDYVAVKSSFTVVRIEQMFCTKKNVACNFFVLKFLCYL